VGEKPIAAEDFETGGLGQNFCCRRGRVRVRGGRSTLAFVR